MSRRGRSFGLIVFATGSLIACRALVGIEELDVADAGTDASADARTDAASADAGSDAVAAKNAECSRKTTECRKCCKDAYQELRDLDRQPGTRNCLCAAPLCGAAPACIGDGGYCNGGVLSGECVPCVDDAFIRDDCTLDCKSPGCLAGLSCLQGCR